MFRRADTASPAMPISGRRWRSGGTSQFDAEPRAPLVDQLGLAGQVPLGLLPVGPDGELVAMIVIRPVGVARVAYR